MNLTTTEKYALAVLEAEGKLAALRKQERGICLVASCIWDMIEAEAVVPNEKGKLTVSAPLPETLGYCGPIYELLGKKLGKPEDVVLEFTYTLTDRRIKTLVKSIADGLIGKGVLVVEEQGGLVKKELCHVDVALLAEDMAVLKNMDGAVTPDQFMLAILLLESGVAKKLLSREELACLKKAAKRDNSDFQPYVENMIAAVYDCISAAVIAAAIAAQ